MQKFIALILIAASSVSMSASSWDTSNLKNILGGGSSKEESSKSSENSLLGAITGIVSGLLSSEKLTVQDLEGNWEYSEPAVCFQSENFLQKAGGAAVTGTIEEKLKPYYKTTGLDKLKLTVESDSTFTLTVRNIPLKGTLLPVNDDSQYNFEFQFQAFKLIKLGQMKAYVTKNVATGTIDLMFDVSKLVAIAEKVSLVAKSSIITSTVSLLKSYDGICVGFTLNNVGKTTNAKKSLW